MYRVNARPIEDATDIDAWLRRVRRGRGAMIACFALFITSATWLACPRAAHAKKAKHLVASPSSDATSGHFVEQSTTIAFVGKVQSTSTFVGGISMGRASPVDRSAEYWVFDPIVPARLPRFVTVSYGDVPPNELPREGSRVIVRATCTAWACVGSTDDVWPANEKTIAEWKRFNAN